ncbi:MAG: type II secretion system secretin GspD [Paracoccaceae bacterium]
MSTRSWAASFAGGVRPGGLQRGTDNFINNDVLGKNAPKRALVVPAGEGAVQMALVNAPIASAAKAVLGDALGLNYVVADNVKGTVTIQTTGPVPKTTLIDLFQAALETSNAEITKEGEIYKIVQGSSGSSSYWLAGQTGGTAPIIVAPLKYISAANMAEILSPQTEAGLKVVADKKRNLLLLSGDAQQRASALDTLNLFDVDVLSGKSVALVQLDSADPDAVVTDLKKIFENEEGGMLDGVIDFVPNKDLSSILVITSRAEYLDKAQRWIHELDKSSGSASVYMASYPLQNRSAAEVAPILDQLLSASAGSDGASTGKTVEAASSANAADSSMRVAADDSRNTLIVRGTRAEQEQVKQLLPELDSQPRQVLLEATIAEVSLNNDLELGTRWFFETGNWDFRFSDLDSGRVVPNGASFAGVFGAGGAEVAISALQSVTDVKIISAPSLMVIDNKEGILQIGDQVPVATQTATSTETANAPVLTRIDYRDTGVILRVKPRIGNGGRVILDINQEVSDVKPTKTSGIDSPTIRQRKLQTSVVLGDGQTLALGGLVQEGDNITRSQTPGLGNIPVLGNLFRSKKDGKARSELLIMIRPRVVNNQSDAKNVTNYWRSKLPGANSILGSGLGPPSHTLTDVTQ